MDLGHAFVVDVPDAETEWQLLRFLKLRLNNYPVVAKQKKPWWKHDEKQTYLISSRDNAFLTFGLFPREEMEIGFMQGLIVREAKPDDLEIII